jgi:hypothetical protein
VTKTIEDHYQSAKVFEGSVQAKDWRHARELKKGGALQIGWSICGMFFHTKDVAHGQRLVLDITDIGVQFYCLLWEKYIRANPDLVEYAASFDEFRDPFAGSFPFPQSAVWETVAKHEGGLAQLKLMSAQLREIITLHKQGS